MKIIISAKNETSAEVAGRLRGHRSIPLIAQKTNESLLAAVQGHREDLSIIYLDPSTLLYAVGERFMWETIARINEILGARRTHVLVILCWEEKLEGSARSAFKSRMQSTRVNLAVIGKRDSNQVAIMISKLTESAQFNAYLEKHDTIIDEPRPIKKGARVKPAKQNGRDAFSGTVPNSVFALGGERFVPETPVALPLDDEDTVLEQSTHDTPKPHMNGSAGGTSTHADTCTSIPGEHDEHPDKGVRPKEASHPPDVFDIELDLERLEAAVHAGVAAMFAAYRGSVPAHVPMNPKPRAVTPPSIAAAPTVTSSRTPTLANRQSTKDTGSQFSLEILVPSNPQKGDSALEKLRVNGKEFRLSRRLRKTLELILSQGTCDATLVGIADTQTALHQFVYHANQRLAESGVRLTSRTRRIQLA